MDLTHHSAAVARAALSRLASPVCWLVIGFASACIASPVMPWQTGTGLSAAPTQIPTLGKGVEPQEAIAPVQVQPYEPGGPGPSDNTEWMPGNR